MESLVEEFSVARGCGGDAVDIFSGTKVIFSYIFLILQNYCVIILQYVTLQREIFHGSGREEEK